MLKNVTQDPNMCYYTHRLRERSEHTPAEMPQHQLFRVVRRKEMSKFKTIGIPAALEAVIISAALVAVALAVPTVIVYAATI